MKSRAWIGVCILAVVWATMAAAQQNEDSVKQIVQGQIAWINSMVAEGKMSQADADAQINKLKIQYADIALGTQTAASRSDAVAATPDTVVTPASTTQQGSGAASDPPSANSPAAPAASNRVMRARVSAATTAATGDSPAPIHEVADVAAAPATHSGGGQTSTAMNQGHGAGGHGQGQANTNQPQGGGNAPKQANQQQGSGGGTQNQDASTSCSTAAKSNGAKPKLKCTTDDSNNVTCKGWVSQANASGQSSGSTTNGTVRICVNDDAQKATTLTVDSNGNFDSSGTKLSTKVGDAIVAQQVNGSGDSATYGSLSNEQSAGTCSAAVTWSAGLSPPTVNALPRSGDYISGTVADAKTTTTARICVDDMEVDRVDVDTQGRFTLPYALSPTNAVTAQGITTTTTSGDSARNYGPLSPAQKMPGFAYSTRVYSRFITGVEQSGFSSQGTNTNAFVEAEFRGPFVNGADHTSQLGITAWGRVRLLGGPLPSGTSVVAAVTNPSGTITTSNLSNVGQVVDYVFGPEIRIHQKDHANGNTDRVSLIGGVGATTPLTAGGIQYSLNAPTANSQQCNQLLNNSPYSPLFTNVATGTDTCVVGDKNTKAKISTLSFSPIDRSNFLIKYGGGLRLTHIYPAKNGQAPYSGSIDFLVGQDQEITGGKFHGAVFTVSGVYPLALGSSSFVYLFGSASMKTTGNGPYYPPLVLGTATAPMTPLPASVEVVPLTQPNRDFYRFGVGVNLISLICSAKKAGCDSSTGSGGTNTSASTANNNASDANGSGASPGSAPGKSTGGTGANQGGKKQKNPQSN